VKPAAFEYCRPDTLDEAIALLDEFAGDASVLAGGMSLGPMLNMRLARPAALVDIKRIAGLDAVAIEAGTARSGASLTQAGSLAHAALMRAVPLLRLALPWTGHFQTRNRGTLAGSVAHADPSAETPLVLTTLGGEVELASVRGTRRLAASEFFVDVMTTAREPDEMITALLWPAAPAGARHAFEEIAQRHGDFAIVACAVQAVVGADGMLQSLAFGLGGVESRPLLAETSAFVGERADARLAEAVADDIAARVDPLTDHKASADYRRGLVRTLGTRVLARAFTRGHP
jgi:2-furoyl-CoA dehydrogenase FAD binding subunit